MLTSVQYLSFRSFNLLSKSIKKLQNKFWTKIELYHFHVKHLVTLYQDISWAISGLTEIWSLPNLDKFWYTKPKFVQYTAMLRLDIVQQSCTDISREMDYRLTGNTSMASNPGPVESYSGKREPNRPLIQGIQKIKIDIFLHCLARLHKTWCILQSCQEHKIAKT